MIRARAEQAGLCDAAAGERGTAVDYTWAVAQLKGHVADPLALLYLAASATLLDTGGGRVRFVHQLVQEYFAALAWQEAIGTGDDWLPYWPQGWTEPSGWEETAVLLAGMAPDMTAFVTGLLPVHPALAARCIAESGGPLAGCGGDSSGPGAFDSDRDQPGGAGPRAQCRRGRAESPGRPAARRGADPDGLPDIAWCDVPAGEFIMGNTKQTDELAYGKRDAAARGPNAGAFRISKYPITNAQFEAFVQDGGYTDRWRKCWTAAGWRWKGDRVAPDKYGGVYDLPNHPAVMVTWYEARGVLQLAGREVGHGRGAADRGAMGAGGAGDRWPSLSLGRKDDAGSCELRRDGHRHDDRGGHLPQGRQPRDGVLDMSGNVWEWCRTKWREDYSRQPDECAWRATRAGVAWGRLLL